MIVELISDISVAFICLVPFQSDNIAIIAEVSVFSWYSVTYQVMEPALSSLSKTILFIYLQYLQGLPLITLKCGGLIIFLLFFF